MQSLVSDPRGLAKQVRVPAGRKSEVNPADIALQGRGWSSCQYRNSVAATDADLRPLENCQSHQGPAENHPGTEGILLGGTERTYLAQHRLQ